MGEMEMFVLRRKYVPYYGA